MNSTGNDDPRRHLASVAAILDHPSISVLIDGHSRRTVLDAINVRLDRYRRELGPDDAPPSLDDIAGAVRETLTEWEAESLRPVVNATGVILHTGLGRAVLPRAATVALSRLDRCCNLQIDLETGKRGKRNHMTEQLLCLLTGAEAALVVNNNAAATLLIMAALCNEREVIISRGQLIEIGGSFRLPDCISQSGAVMVEVGTTNKTHLRDYERAMTEQTAAVLRVNPSNYRIVGFSKSVPVEDLVTLKKKQPVMVIDDLGCGALIDVRRFNLPAEPTVADSIAAGADIACFSGDKLIGGPQAGIIVGRRDLIDRIRTHPLTRMLRVGKLTDCALEQTLRLFLDPDSLPQTHPTYRMLTVSPAILRKRAERMQKTIEKATGEYALRVTESESATGGGSMPASTIATWVLAVRSATLTADDLARALLRNEPPVITRISSDEVLIDMRTLLKGEDAVVAQALIAVVEHRQRKDHDAP
jgi:L-seryl-tRNA(Ser) seleniumtransferase